jgi:phosphatidylserine/phosphatidylglycerophosphate/cardiolipin synthase-like enzyme
MDYWMCPEAAGWAQTQILVLVNGAQYTIDVGIYGYAWALLVDALIAAHRRGVKVRVVFDRTQAGGVGERDYVAETVKAGIECYEGTSPMHQIRHTKNMCVDGQRGETGSLNYSVTGFAQNNSVIFFDCVSIAQRITSDLDDNIAWLVSNESAYQQQLQALAATGPSGALP